MNTVQSIATLMAFIPLVAVSGFLLFTALAERQRTRNASELKAAEREWTERLVTAEKSAQSWRLAAEMAKADAESIRREKGNDFDALARRFHESERQRELVVSELQSMRRERDAALAERDGFYREVCAASKRAAGCDRPGMVEELRDRLNRARAKCDKARRERHEALAELKCLRGAELRFCNSIKGGSYAVTIAELERAQVVYFPPQDRIELIKNPEPQR